MRILSEQDVDRLIEPLQAIDTAIEAYRLHSREQGSQIGRLDLRRAAPKGGALTLAGFFGDEMVVKTNVHAYPNDGARLAGSMLIVWDAITCKPQALISSFSFNSHRTAAGFAAAARILAPADARTLTLFGSGKIAPLTARYLAAVRPIDRILILSRRVDRATELARELRSAPDLVGVEVLVGEDPAQAVRESDIVATVTTSDTPVFPGDAVRPGALVILGGANRPDAREGDDALCARAQVVVDHLAGCMERAGDIKMALESKALKRQQIIGEIGALSQSAVKVPGADVTVFKSIGIASQDMMLARWLLSNAKHHGIGIEVDLDGSSLKAHADVLQATQRMPAVGREKA